MHKQHLLPFFLERAQEAHRGTFKNINSILSKTRRKQRWTIDSKNLCRDSKQLDKQLMWKEKEKGMVAPHDGRWFQKVTHTNYTSWRPKTHFEGQKLYLIFNDGFKNWDAQNVTQSSYTQFDSERWGCTKKITPFSRMCTLSTVTEKSSFGLLSLQNNFSPSPVLHRNFPQIADSKTFN